MNECDKGRKPSMKENSIRPKSYHVQGKKKVVSQKQTLGMPE